MKTIPQRGITEEPKGVVFFPQKRYISPPIYPISHMSYQNQFINKWFCRKPFLVSHNKSKILKFGFSTLWGMEQKRWCFELSGVWPHNQKLVLEVLVSQKPHG